MEIAARISNFSTVRSDAAGGFAGLGFFAYRGTKKNVAAIAAA
jgi:hypothetical protein